MTSGRIFLDDPTKTHPLTIDATHLKCLPGSNLLHAGFVDYLIQQSFPIKKDQQTIIASSLSLSYMQAYLANDDADININAHDTHHAQGYLRTIYQYYSTSQFRFFSMVCSDNHFFLVSLKFHGNHPNKHIFTDVHVYDSLKLVTRE
jgi:hypothetical protein